MAAAVARRGAGNGRSETNPALAVPGCCVVGAPGQRRARGRGEAGRRGIPGPVVQLCGESAAPRGGVRGPRWGLCPCPGRGQGPARSQASTGPVSGAGGQGGGSVHRARCPLSWVPSLSASVASMSSQGHGEKRPLLSQVSSSCSPPWEARARQLPERALGLLRQRVASLGRVTHPPSCARFTAGSASSSV